MVESTSVGKRKGEGILDCFSGDDVTGAKASTSCFLFAIFATVVVVPPNLLHTEQ